MKSLLSLWHREDKVIPDKQAWSFPVGPDHAQTFGFERAVRNCHALNAKSWQDEAVQLDTGVWVVLWVYPWSATSAMSIPVAIETISKLDGNVQLGIRCGDGEWNLHNWCPLAKAEAQDPIWLFLRNGEVVEQKIGFLGGQQVTQIVNELLLNL